MTESKTPRTDKHINCQEAKDIASRDVLFMHQLETELEEANRRVAEVEAELDKFLQAIESDSVEGGDAGAVVSRRVSVNDALAEWKYIWTVWNESMEAIMLGEAWPKNSFPSLIERAGFAALKARAEAAGTRLAG